jgi:hypothetical protein
MSDLSKLREDMVENQIAARSIRSAAVLGALRKVPREAFLPERLREFAYEDSPLPIDAGQTISQPYIVALIEVDPVSWTPKCLSFRSARWQRNVPLMRRSFAGR